MNKMSLFRKWSRLIHRDLSYFFAGIILIYALSGLMLNHKKDYNFDYAISREELRLPGNFPSRPDFYSRENVEKLLKTVNEGGNYIKHYFPDSLHMKIFVKGGSSLVIDVSDGYAVYESIKKRPVLSTLNRLHYNPGRWWTIFSDLFAVSLLIITITGLVMLKGSKGLWGRGGIEMLAGLLFPLLFLIFS